MANTLFELGRQKFLDGMLSWSRDNIKMWLLDTDVSGAVDVTNDEITQDIVSGDPTSVAGAIVAISSAFASKTSIDGTVGGVADAADVLYSSVSGATVEELIIFNSVEPYVAPSTPAAGTGLTKVGDIITLNTTTTSPFASTHERGFVKITSSGSGNDGTFFITEYVDANTIRYYNTGGATEAVGPWDFEIVSPLIGRIDTATTLPVTPNGGNITVAWDNTAGLRIFKL